MVNIFDNNNDNFACSENKQDLLIFIGSNPSNQSDFLKKCGNTKSLAGSLLYKNAVQRLSIKLPLNEAEKRSLGENKEVKNDGSVVEA